MPCASAPRAATSRVRATRKRRILCPSLRYLEPAHPNGTGAAGQGRRAAGQAGFSLWTRGNGKGSRGKGSQQLRSRIPAPSARERLEEVPDRELEQIRIVAGPAGEREANLEAQRAEGREPTEAKARAVEKAQRQGPATLRALEEVLLLREDVARVVEDDAAKAGPSEDGELDLPVGDQLLVASDREVDHAGVRLAGRGDGQRRRDAAQRVAANGVDAAFEEFLADGDRMVDGFRRADVADRDVRLEHHAEHQGPVETLDHAEALEEVLAAEQGRGEFGRRRLEMAVGGKEAVVALVVVEGDADARGAARGELIRENVLGAHRGGHVDLLQRVGEEEAEVLQPRRDVAEVVSGGERSAVRRPVESGEQQLAPVQIDGTGPLGVEHVRVEVAELEELADAGDLQRERSGVPVPEQVV